MADRIESKIQEVYDFLNSEVENNVLKDFSISE